MQTVGAVRYHSHNSSDGIKNLLRTSILADRLQWREQSLVKVNFSLEYYLWILNIAKSEHVRLHLAVPWGGGGSGIHYIIETRVPTAIYQSGTLSFVQIIEIMVLLRQLSYAIKNQLKALKAPY